MLVGLLLTSLSDSFPPNLGSVARLASYLAFGFAVISALLSLFEDADEAEIGEFDRTDPPFQTRS